ncbi:MAG: GatB/YqeY domain-containing protein [Thermoleophilia bacterium]|nr:GatB/YqeY domain-containing protein [Thermoleophilia bacterium]
MIERIETDLKEAMRRRDPVRRSTLRLTLAALRAAEKELDRPLKVEEELQVLQRERKRRLESVRAFREAGREEQAASEEEELRVLEELLPEPVSEAELERIVENAIAETGATSLRDLGRVMADVMPQVAGRADGSSVSQLVRELLA